MITARLPLYALLAAAITVGMCQASLQENLHGLATTIDSLANGISRGKVETGKVPPPVNIPPQEPSKPQQPTTQPAYVGGADELIVSGKIKVGLNHMRLTDGSLMEIATISTSPLQLFTIKGSPAIFDTIMNTLGKQAPKSILLKIKNFRGEPSPLSSLETNWYATVEDILIDHQSFINTIKSLCGNQCSIIANPTQQLIAGLFGGTPKDPQSETQLLSVSLTYGGNTATIELAPGYR
jgi:hypothetical protein